MSNVVIQLSEPIECKFSGIIFLEEFNTHHFTLDGIRFTDYFLPHYCISEDQRYVAITRLRCVRTAAGAPWSEKTIAELLVFDRKLQTVAGPPAEDWSLIIPKKFVSKGGWKFFRYAQQLLVNYDIQDKLKNSTRDSHFLVSCLVQGYVPWEELNAPKKDEPQEEPPSYHKPVSPAEKAPLSTFSPDRLSALAHISKDLFWKEIEFPQTSRAAYLESISLQIFKGVSEKFRPFLKDISLRELRVSPSGRLQIKRDSLVVLVSRDGKWAGLQYCKDSFCFPRQLVRKLKFVVVHPAKGGGWLELEFKLWDKLDTKHTFKKYKRGGPGDVFDGMEECILPTVIGIELLFPRTEETVRLLREALEEFAAFFGYPFQQEDYSDC